MSPRRKLALLACLYLSQGLPFGFFTQTLPVILRRQEVSLPAIGLSSLLALPWALKFLWAPLVDRHGSPRWGRRRSWILPLQVLAGLVMLALAAFDPATSLLPLLIGVGLVNLLAATHDIATDGLAVDLLKPDERGLGNGVQVAGYRAGMILGGGLLLVVLDHTGWAVTCAALSAALLLAAIPIGLHRERPQPTAERPPAFLGALWRPGLLPWLGLLAVYKLGDALGTGMLRPFLVDEGLDLSQIGWLLGLVGFTAGLLGALAGGALIQRLGRRRALVGFAVLQALGMAGYVFAAWSPIPLWALTAVCAFEHFVGGMATAALFTVMMDACRPEAAASDYTLQACAVVIATGTAAALSGFSAQALGYAGHFVLSLVMCAVAAVSVGVMRLESPTASKLPG